MGYQGDAGAFWGGVEAIRRHPVDRPAALSRVNPAGLRDRADRWTAEWAVPQGIVDHLALVLARDGGTIGCVGLGRHRDRGPISASDLAAVRLLTPHLQHTAAIARLLDEPRGVAGRLAAALALPAAPVVLLAEDATVLHANAVARALLAAGVPLVVRGGRLTSPVPEVARALQRALRRCGQGEGGLRHDGFGIPARCNGAEVYALHVLPLGGSGARRQQAVSRAVATLFVASPRARPDGRPGATISAGAARAS